jgi:hypothetical protein
MRRMNWFFRTVAAITIRAEHAGQAQITNGL